MNARPATQGYGAATWLYLVAVILSWGGNWPLMKIALADMAPTSFAALRVAGAAVVVVLIQLWTRRPLLPQKRDRRHLAVIGLFQVAGMIGFSILGLQFITAGRGVVLAYTFQLWAMLLGAWLLGETFGRRKLLAAAIGFAGLVLFFNPTLVDWTSSRVLLGNACVLLGAICWAAGATLYRRRPPVSEGWAQTSWQLLVSIPPLVLVALLVDGGRPIDLHWSTVAILLYNWTVPTALGYWWWGKVLEAMPAGAAGQILMLTPLFGFFLSAVFLGDRVTLDVVLSVVLIVAGLVLSLGGRRA